MFASEGYGMQQYNILIVEDNQTIADKMRELLGTVEKIKQILSVERYPGR